MNFAGIVPKLSLGTYLVHGEQLFTAVDNALSIGYRSFDTARYYENEKELGDALKVLLPKHNLRMEDVYITTKLFPMPVGSASNTIELQVHESMRCLGRSYLDLVLVHYPRPVENDDQDRTNRKTRENIWKSLEKLHKSGIIRNLGVSNYEIQHIEEIREYGSMMPAVNQVEYHPHFQRAVLREYCRQEKIEFQAFSPLGRQNPTLLEAPEILKIASKHAKSTAWIILRWAIQNHVSVVAKSVTPSRLAQNFEATVSTKIELDESEMKILNSLCSDSPYVEDNGWLCL